MSEELVKLTAEIVAAYVAHNSIRPADVDELITQVHASLGKVFDGKTELEVEAKPMPMMPVKKTIHRDYLISLEDGQRYKTLRRHLSTRGLKPDEYRAKWGLPADYPMVAKAYSETRSGLAKALGLGARRSAEAETDVEQATVPVEEAAAPVKKATKAAVRPHTKAEQTRKRAPRAKKIDAEAAAEAQEAA